MYFALKRFVYFWFIFGLLNVQNTTVTPYSQSGNVNSKTLGKMHYILNFKQKKLIDLENSHNIFINYIHSSLISLDTN